MHDIDSLHKRARDYYVENCMKNKQKPSLVFVVKINTDGVIPVIFKRAGFPDMLVWVWCLRGLSEMTVEHLAPKTSKTWISNSKSPSAS